jgi:hypothetical protein
LHERASRDHVVDDDGGRVVFHRRLGRGLMTSWAALSIGRRRYARARRPLGGDLFLLSRIGVAHWSILGRVGKKVCVDSLVYHLSPYEHV